MKRNAEEPAVSVAMTPVPSSPAPPTPEKRAKRPAPPAESAAPPARFVAAAPVAFELAPPEHPTGDQIRERAYFIYLSRDGGPGDPNADWLRAERELIAERAKSRVRRIDRSSQ